MAHQLTCPACSGSLTLSVGYSGCDWDTMAGEGSGYGYPMSLNCNNEDCSYVWMLGYLNDESAFSPVIEKMRPYTDVRGYVVDYPKKKPLR